MVNQGTIVNKITVKRLIACYLFHSTKIGRISSELMISGFCETPVTDKIPKRKIRKVRFKFTTL